MTIRAQWLGRVARDVLARDTQGVVLAGFEHGVTLMLGAQGIVHLGAIGLVPGPCNVGCEHAPDGWEDHCAGTVVSGSPARLRIGEWLDVDLSGATLWCPPPVEHLCSRDEIVAGARESVATALDQAPTGGLLRAVLCGSRASTLERAAARPIAALSDWLGSIDDRALDAPPSTEVASLLGMGPGLTPSGDDLLVGILVALWGAGNAHAAVQLARLLDAQVDVRTSAISAAYLRAAMQGEAAAPIHDCVSALWDGKPAVAQAIRALAAYGHTSGWDAFAGVWLVARAISVP